MKAPLLLALLVAPAFALDTVDLQVGPRDKVLGTLRPVDERESYLVAALRGTSVKAVAKRTSDGAPNPAVELLDGKGTTLVTATATGKGSKITGVELPAGDLWRFRVTGDGVLDGDFQLALTLVPRAVWTGAADAPLDAGFEDSFSFAAPAGATARIDLRSADGKFAPRILDLAGPSGALFAGDEPDSAKLHRMTDLALPVAGEHTVRFRNDGAAAGRWKVQVRLTIARDARSTADLRDDALAGSFAGVQTVFGRIATPDADTLITGPAGTTLEDVSILIPAGALAVPTLVGLSESETFFSGDDANPAGTTISFTPSGTTFATPATVTAPYDPQAFDDPATELTAVVVEDAATGAQETVAVTSVDTVESTVTYPATHFSRFQPVSPRPRNLRGHFREIEIVGRTTDGFGGEITLGQNTFRGLQGARAQHGMTRDLNRLTVAWGIDSGGVPRVSATSDQRSTGGIVNVVTNESVSLVNGGGDFALARGRSPDVLAGAGPRPGGLETYVALRRAKGVPTRGNLAGGWHGIAWEFRAAANSGKVLLQLSGQEFELDVDAGGVAVASSSHVRRSSCDLGVTPWVLTKDKRSPRPGRLDPDGTAARLTLGLLGGALPGENALDPVLRGDALIGGAIDAEGDLAATGRAVLRVVVLVRRTSGLLPGDVLGRSLAASVTALPVDGMGPSRIEFAATTSDVRFAADGTFAQGGTRTVASHDAQGAPTLVGSPFSRTAAFVAREDGRVVFAKPAPSGFLTPRREALLLFDVGTGALVFGAASPARP